MGRTSKTKQLLDEACEDEEYSCEEGFNTDDETFEYSNEKLRSSKHISNQQSTGQHNKNYSTGESTRKRDKLVEEQCKDVLTKKLSILGIESRQKEIEICNPNKSTSFIIGGHVDSGKSTLLGHFLHSIGNVSTKEMKQCEKEATKTGKSSFKYAWILDQNPEERSRGTTIDLSIHSFTLTDTDNDDCITVIDAPGHRDYTDCLIHGVFMADHAVIVIDGPEMLKKGIASGTEEHFRIFSYALRDDDKCDSSLLVIINKMDKLDWSHYAFLECESIILSYMERASICGFGSIKFVPCSAWCGDHLAKTKNDINWCKEYPTLLESLIDTKHSSPKDPIVVTYSLVLICQMVKTGSNSVVIDVKVLQGIIETGMTLYLPFSSGKCAVKQIELPNPSDHLDSTSFKGKRMNFVGQSEYATITCDHLEESIAFAVTRSGQLLWSCDEPPKEWISSATLVCRLHVQDGISLSQSIIITPGTSCIFYYRNTQVSCVITKLVSLYQKEKPYPPKFITNNQIAIVHIQTTEEIVVYTKSDIQCRMLSKFILSFSGSVIGRGLILDGK